MHVMNVTKMAESYWVHVKPLSTFQQASYSKKHSKQKLNPLRSRFPVNPVHLQFCGYTMLNTFVP